MQTALRPGGRAGGHARALRRPDRPGRAGGGAGQLGRGARGRRRADRRRAGQPRLRVGQGAGDRARSSATPASRCSTATPSRSRGRLRRGQGVRRRVRPAGARARGARTIIKLFVREAVDEALKLETALSRLRTERQIALLHYSPIAGTVEGEPLEIYPYLGSSRLEEPLTRYPVDVRLPRPRPPRHAGGADDGRRPGLQRLAGAAAAQLPGPSRRSG